MVEDGYDRRHFEAVVIGELEYGVGAVLVDGIEAEQFRGAPAVDRELGPHHDRSARGTAVYAPIGAVQALEVARQRRRPRQPQMGESHRLRLLAEAVARQDRIGVLAREVDEHAAQPVYRPHECEELLALRDIHADRAQVARAPREMHAPADVLAQ